MITIDKQVYTARQKITADDMNQDITDAETGINQVVFHTLYDEDTIVTGLTATGTGTDSITVASGRAFHGDTGKEVDISSSQTLTWDGTDGQVAGTSTNRLDLVCVAHSYQDGATQSRLFIDTDTTSSTYGQAIASSVVVDKDDYYTFSVVSGTTTTGTPQSVPFATSGTIPLFTVAIYSGTTTNIYTSNINNNAFRHLKSEVVDTLRDVQKMFVWDSGWVAVTWATSGSTIGTTMPNLSPSLNLSIRDNGGTHYMSERTFDYTARYTTDSGDVSVINNTSDTSRYARVVLMD